MLKYKSIFICHGEVRTEYNKKIVFTFLILIPLIYLNMVLRKTVNHKIFFIWDKNNFQFISSQSIKLSTCSNAKLHLLNVSMNI